MRRAVICCLVLILASALRVPAQPAPAEPSDAIRARAVELRTIDPLDENFSDLAPLKQVLKGRRVVILGEPEHGGGTVFLAKTRLIKFLHEEMGFNVLAWEDGMYDARLTWQHLVAGDPPRDAATLGVVPIWSVSRQTDELWRYLARTSKTAHPLQLVGIDTHVSATQRAQEVRTALLADLKRLNHLSPKPLVADAAFDDLVVLWDEKVRTPERSASAIRALESLRDGLLRPAAIEAIGAREAMWWRQCLATFVFKIRNVTLPTGGQGPMAPVFNPRDFQMGRNLLWYAKTYDPKAKIIVWSATMHGVRHPETIDPLDASVDYTDVMPMGHYAWLGLGRELYVLGFVAFDGQVHLPWGFAGGDVDPAPPGSLEAHAADAGVKQAWIDLAQAAPDSWLRGDVVARPLGYVPMKAHWQDHLDGFFFIKTVKPSERAPKAK